LEVKGDEIRLRVPPLAGEAILVAIMDDGGQTASAGAGDVPSQPVQYNNLSLLATSLPFQPYNRKGCECVYIAQSLGNRIKKSITEELKGGSNDHKGRRRVLADYWSDEKPSGSAV
jgi:hypothetical protein